MVRIAGLEPARVAPLPPQSSVSANSTICAEAVIMKQSSVGDASPELPAALSPRRQQVGRWESEKVGKWDVKGLTLNAQVGVPGQGEREQEIANC